jgi:predicted enzyme related to lactoylglutathione lyase
MPNSSVRGHFLWHEVMTTDPLAAAAFYQKIIGWKREKWDQDPSYTVLSYQGKPMAGVMSIPAEAKAMGTAPSWMSYIGTPDVDVTAWDAQRLGAKLHKGPTSTPTVGRWAVLQDPQGATFAIYTPERAPAAGGEAGIADFSWHELATRNQAAAFDFYRELFGWQQTGSFDMGAQGSYLMYGLGKQTFGGILTMMGEQAKSPPCWLPYIRVANVQRTTKAIQAASATILMGPHEVPGGEWITQAKDPQGAVFAIHAKRAKSAARPAPRAKTTTRKTAGKRTTKRPGKRTKTVKKRER